MTMYKRIFAVIMIMTLAGCGESIVEVSLSEADVARFIENADALAARDDARSPLAMSVLASNQIGAPEGVQVWNTGPLLSALGIRNGDIIALVDGNVPSRDYGHSFAAGQEPFASATEQYVHFVSGLLDLRRSQDAVVLHVHSQYRTLAEREKHGALHTKEPVIYRVVFE